MDKSIIFLKTIDYVKIGSFRALFYFTHEMAHFRHLVLSERYFQKIREAYSSARAQNKYFGAYASKNHLEYFAEVSASFLLPRSRGHVYPRGARELKQYDIGAFNLCSVIWNNDTLARRNRADDNPIALQEPQLSVELDATIRIAIKKPTGALTSADIENVRVIDLRSKQLTDLGYLSKLTQLKSLMLFNNKITDVNPLKDLRQLTELDISHNLITDVSPLKELKQLKFLNLCDNPNLDKTQIYLLQKELPKCSIYQNAAK
jgi:Leucine-rich repeat (LRR) protein